MNVPALARILQRDTHRLISSKHSEGSEFVRVSNAVHDLRDMDEMERATIDPLPAQIHPLQGADITSSGISCRRVVNDTFGYPNRQGGRFNSSKRGAWYAGFELETSQAEIVWHKSRDLLDIGRLEESVSYDDYLADFGGEFHDIREDTKRENYLDPQSHVESQALAESLIEHGSSGIIYPSVRHEGGNCIVCFRPALVGNVRKSERYRFTWFGSVVPRIEVEET